MRFRKENLAGLYLTVIIHLTVIIILLSCKITRLVVAEQSFVLDFSQQEEAEMLRQQEEFKADISEQLDEILASAKAQDRSNIRNVAVDANEKRTGEQLRDDRGASDVYDQARELQRKLEASRKAAMAEEQFEDNAVDLTEEYQDPVTDQEGQYNGASVLSFSLDGRKAQGDLPVPAYQCPGGGDVSVMIEVNRSGRVVKAEVIDEVSEPDACVKEAALRAAKRSLFTAKDDAPERQRGEIVYRFIAQ